MEISRVLFCRHFVVLYLLQMVTPSSEQFMVNALKGPILAPFGGQVELSCQLSPPQSARHMEIRWFQNHYTQPIYLYKEGKDLYGETTSRYVEWTELLKDAIEEGNLTLRIFNVSVEDDGQYHCFFRDGDFSEEDITEVKVTDQLFSHKKIWILIVVTLLIVLIASIAFPSVARCRKQPGQGRYCSKNSPWLVGTIIFISSVILDIGLGIYLHKHQRVPASDRLFALDAIWVEDMIMILWMLMVFITMLISLIYFRIKDAMN